MVICAKLGEDNSGHPWAAEQEWDRRSAEERLQLLGKRIAKDYLPELKHLWHILATWTEEISNYLDYRKPIDL